jgi:hypothetical protein
VVAIKEGVELAPWADVVYGCDAAWWRSRHGLPKFAGRRIAYSGGKLEFPGIETVDIDPRGDRLLFDGGKVGGGGNSGFQAINLVAFWGARKIILVGFDMNPDTDVHWYGRNRWPMAHNPNEACFRRWRRAMENAAAQLKERGVDVVNCSPMTAIKAFPVKTLEEAIA